MRFTTLLGLSYDVQRASEVTRSLWSIVSANLPGTGGIIQSIDTNAAADSRRFYRVLSKHRLRVPQGSALHFAF